ncbi:MAG: DUF2336 domain-containing protein [Alphaproteobacteria bacterium]|jgi:uncharacterized protein (DUF2336 family)|nr:DUF2336 domain-containing protein [Alphaproteobacteria bacterium]
MSIVTMRTTLTETDIRMLVKGSSDEDRAFAAHKLCRQIDYADLNDGDRAYASEILRIIAGDAAALVRRSLATALKSSPKLPPEIARQLALDIDSIALPILESSPSLSDSDLVEVLRAAGPKKQVAVASRSSLSETVTQAIAEHGVQEALERALANDNARFAASGLMAAIRRFPDQDSVTLAMVNRRALPVAVVEKLVTMVSGEVFDRLVNSHQLPPQLAIELAANARERATLDLVEQAGLQSDTRRFAQQLSIQGRLTPSFVMRALCLGHMDFVEHALAELAGLNHHRTWLMMHDAGPLGLKTLFDRTGLPPRLFSAFRAGVDVYHQLEREGLSGDRERLRQRMIERVLTLFQSIPSDDLDYLLEKLDACSAGARAIAS